MITSHNSLDYKTFCFADQYFKAFKALKLIQQLADNLNFKGLSFFIHPVEYIKEYTGCLKKNGTLTY